MDQIIRGADYKDQKAVVLESSQLKAVFLPETGGKLASLENKAIPFEYLYQTEGDAYRAGAYDSKYTEGECSGYDDMFPAIDESFYEHYPWKGARIPDHGEIWSIPWDCRTDETAVWMCVHGVRFPYEIVKKIYLSEENSLRIDYLVRNRSNFSFHYIWAGHIMLPYMEHALIEVPDQLDLAVCVISKNNRFGSYGNTFSWKNFMEDMHRIDILPSDITGDVDKCYFTKPMSGGWNRVKYSMPKHSLDIAFCGETELYLGILINNRGSRNVRQVIIEPCTSMMDRIDTAEKYQACSILMPKGQCEWSVEMTVHAEQCSK